MIVDKHNQGWAEYTNNLEKQSKRRLELLVRAMNALEGWRILLDMPITDIMTDIEKELEDDVAES